MINLNGEFGVGKLKDSFFNFSCPLGTSGQGHTEDSLGFGFIYYGLSRCIVPETVVCIGSQKGFAPSIFGKALKDNGKGTVYFIDAGFDEETDGHKAWAGKGLWKKYKDKIFKENDLNNVELILSRTQDVSWDRRIDILYIDGDHSYEGVKHDFEKFSPYANFVLFHDSLYTAEGVATDYHNQRRDISHWKGHEWGVKDFLKELDHLPKFEIPMFAGLTLIDFRKFNKLKTEG